MSTAKEEMWMDAQGKPVHVATISESKKLESQLVVELVGKAKVLSSDIDRKKAEFRGDIQAYLDLAREKWKMDPIVNSAKGNFQFTSFDKQTKIKVTIQNRIEFGVELVFAKEKIDALLVQEVEHATPILKTLISNVFEVNKEDRVSVQQILKLRTYKIDNPLWDEAMKLIDSSISIVDSKSNLTFYERSESGSWKQVPLNFSALEGKCE